MSILSCKTFFKDKKSDQFWLNYGHFRVTTYCPVWDIICPILLLPLRKLGLSMFVKVYRASFPHFLQGTLSRWIRWFILFCFKLIYFQRITQKQYCLSWRFPTRWVLVLYSGVWPKKVMMLYELSDAYTTSITVRTCERQHYRYTKCIWFESIKLSMFILHIKDLIGRNYQLKYVIWHL